MITCQFENGNKAALRHVVVDIIVLQNNQVLLVKRNQKLSEGGKWALVGGYAERDEKLEETVKREIGEETGYEVKNIKLLTIHDNPDRPHDDDRQNISFVYFCEAVKKTNGSDWEVEETKWFDLDKLPPKEQVAFDHFDNLELYKEYLKSWQEKR